ncbi:SMEK domain-containing protein [Chryseobacterium sp. Ch-15]|uniref:SMEK domain-containing protein n=1 Tax=Chryseobacterium muglaense TaxID=2893752 RepID=A0A9Q3V1J2_9FLAO|nr:SMEK domain-containing protein [Chryseobacterium muglaense]MBD3905415.1 SMEK domain-containing protein [Chryseobacterium muglaense]MCC9036860.1 SMEK domain-containing protein [Chryseobacterium muglaense]MCM2555278.1 SMEK domain-containing protein [Chryseobacterium muglaense]
MISRGFIIGQLIDDLALLQQKIIFRNKIGYLDLTKVCEDFFKEILNVILDYNLSNLNANRSNEPGLDLGDLHNKIAVQVTSQRKTEKINDTLRKISEENRLIYERFIVFIIGQKQNSYAIDHALATTNNFDKDSDIIDIDFLIKHIAVADEIKLTALQKIFKREMRNVVVELEPISSDGDFESSIYNFIEAVPSTPPKNTIVYDRFYNTLSNQEFFTKLYNELAEIPRAQREYIAVIAERGQLNGWNRYEIHGIKLANILGVSEEKLFKSLSYLDDINIVRFDKDTDEFERPINKYVIRSEELNTLIKYLHEASINIRKMIVTLDFSILEENEQN